MKAVPLANKGEKMYKSPKPPLFSSEILNTNVYMHKIKSYSFLGFPAPESGILLETLIIAFLANASFGLNEKQRLLILNCYLWWRDPNEALV